ncbi:MAG: orotidine 5'-phosphate decarboxylase / HUMPS family protein, partial [Acidimicrobiales bacterium]
GALFPMVRAARATGRGLFVVVTSSNPEGREVQEALRRDGSSVEQAMVRTIARWNVEEADEAGRGGPGRLGAVGAVVGATGGAPPEGLDGLAGVVLAPGLGAQGATVADVARRFAACARGSVLPVAARAVLGRGPVGVRAAAERLRDELAAALP